MPYRDDDHRPTINWVMMAKEIADVPGGLAVLRVIQVHGIDMLVKRSDKGDYAHCTVEHFITMVHEAGRR